jgi:hypothetical protein
MDIAENKQLNLAKVFNITLSVRLHEITTLVYESTQGIVQGGPFRGMRLLRQKSWGAGEISPKLLGCYEAELIPSVIEAMAKKYPKVINVGCAEGYYAVGLARRMPLARIVAYDTSRAAQSVCKDNAELNGVAGRVAVRGECTRAALAEELADGVPTFIVMDCEGAEMLLLDPASVPLEHCDILVECHDLFNPEITPTLLDRLSRTHSVERIEEGGRNPNFPILRNQDSVSRWIAVCEFRSAPQHWLVFRRKVAHESDGPSAHA